MKIGDPEQKWGYNLRISVLDMNSVEYRVSRYEYNDGNIEQGFKIVWKHKNEVSAYDGLVRSAPDIDLFNLLEGESHVE